METTGLFWDFMSTQSVQVAMVFGVVSVVNWMLRNRSAHIRYLLWLVVLVKCVTPPVVTFSLPVLPGEIETRIPAAAQPEIVMQGQSGESGLMEPIYVEPGPVENPVPPVSEQMQGPLLTHDNSVRDTMERPGLSRIMLCVIFWAAGAACYLLWALGRAMLLQRRLKRSRRPLPAELMIEQIETLGQLWDYPGGFKVWLMDGIGQPFVWGLWRGAIYLPTRFQSIQTDRQKAIVIHEMAHVVRLDAFVNLLQILIQGVFWFHPLVWLANRVIRQEREKCCDEIAVARLGTAPREYGSAIVDTLLQEVQTTLAIPTLAVAGPVKNIEDRIKTIMQPGRRFLRRPSMAAILIIGLLAAVIVPTTIALTHKVTPPDYVLSGTVMDAQSGQPIAGAIVLDDGYGPQPYQKGITDDAGKFEYKSWNEEHNITARADGYKSQTMVFTTAPLDNSKALHFKLSKAAPGEKVDLVPAAFDLQIDSRRSVCFPVVTIANEGKVALPKMKLRFYRGNPDKNLDETGNEHHGWHEAGPIEPGKTWSERTDGFHLNDGVYEFAVVLDYDHAIAETDETNNTMSLQIKVVNGQVAEKLVASSLHKQRSPEAGLSSSQLAGGIIEAVLLPEYLESHTVLSLKTGRLMPQQQADDLKEPYLGYTYTFPPGQSPSQYTVNTIPERYIGVDAGGMNTGGLGWSPESAGLQHLWSIDRIEALPDCPQRARITMGDFTTNGTFIGLPLPEPEREKQWPFITAFKGDDGTSGVFEITKIENRKIFVRFKVLNSSETAIRLERKELLKKMLETEEQKFQSGLCGPMEVLGAKLNLLAVEKELARTPQERIAVLQQIAALSQEAENMAKLMFESGRATEAELNQAKLERLKAEEELARAEAAGGKQISEYSAVLPNGVKVELLGICEHPSEGKQWRRPDGSPMERPYKRYRSTIEDADYALYEMAYRVTGDEQVLTEVALNESVKGRFEAEEATLQTQNNCLWGVLSFAKGTERADIVILVGSNTLWQTDTAMTAQEGSSLANTTTNGPHAMIASPIEKDGKVYVHITHSVHDRRYRVVAFDKKGVLHAHTGSGSVMNPDKKMGMINAVFDVPLADIQSIQFQIQEFQPVLFKNVSLKDGKKTDIKIEIPKELK